jgi:hypothetical protein
MSIVSSGGCHERQSRGGPVDSTVGRIGQLACWEHYNPLARYAMMADGEQGSASVDTQNRPLIDTSKPAIS